jgi:hypothetical protein
MLYGPDGNLLLNARHPGQGVRLGDYIENHFGWRDITGQVVQRGVGANDPSWAQIGSGPFYAYKFAVNDEVWMTYHVPHDLVVAPVHWHCHWTPVGASLEPVKWEVTYTNARGFGIGTFDENGTTVTAEEAPPATLAHMVTETAGIDMVSIEVDSLILARIRRLTNSATENTSDIFMLTADIHYQSSNLATRNKAPNFYE